MDDTKSPWAARIHVVEPWHFDLKQQVAHVILLGRIFRPILRPLVHVHLPDAGACCPPSARRFGCKTGQSICARRSLRPSAESHAPGTASAEIYLPCARSPPTIGTGIFGHETAVETGTNWALFVVGFPSNRHRILFMPTPHCSMYACPRGC